MNRAEINYELSQKPQDVRFLANVISTQHGNAAQKLRGLLFLVNNGLSVRTGTFSIDTLVVNGGEQPWRLLDEAGEFIPSGLGRVTLKLSVRAQELLDELYGETEGAR